VASSLSWSHAAAGLPPAGRTGDRQDPAHRDGAGVHDRLAGERRTAPIMFRGAPLRATKRFVDGTHRTVPPRETLTRIRPFFQTAGITRLADVTGLDRIGITTALAYRPNSPTLSNSAGKGFSLDAALTSAAMEALELYHAEHVRLPAISASHADLARTGAVIPRESLLLRRMSLFRADTPEWWVEAWDLCGQRPVSVPYGVVSMVPHPADRPQLRMPFSVSSNGLASGNHLLEAICAALLEAIERDAVACHITAQKYRGWVFPRIDLRTLALPRVADVLARLQAAGVGAVLCDLTVDTGVPVYAATIYDRRDRHVGMYAGYGAHLDPEIAMIRALTEAVQSRAIYIAGSRDDYFRHDHLRHRMNDNPQSVESLESASALKDVSGLRSEATATFEGDVATLVEKLHRAGLEQVLVADLTHADVGIPVVRVIVPGLETYPFHRHYAPGRRATAFCGTRLQD
jgi:ribosomal protein S12 methylthiotransferase accessory factor